jgi:hypothetical protein
MICRSMYGFAFVHRFMLPVLLSMISATLWLNVSGGYREGAFVEGAVHSTHRPYVEEQMFTTRVVVIVEQSSVCLTV